MVQDGSEGKVCLHWAAESAHPAAPNIVQLLCKKQYNLIEAKVSLLTEVQVREVFPMKFIKQCAIVCMSSVHHYIILGDLLR